MRHAIGCCLVAAGVLLVRWADQPSADDTLRPQGVPNADALAEITVRVPVADLRVWDPMNVNVNPIPWRVYGSADKGDDRTGRFRHQAIGEAVVIEGIAWGYVMGTETPSSGLPQSRVLFEGGVLLVKGADFNQRDIHGRLVRIKGTLQREAIPGHPGFERQFPDYYFVEANDVAVIDSVTDPHVVRQKPGE